MLITKVITRDYAQTISVSFSIRIKVYDQKIKSSVKSICYILSYKSKTKCYISKFSNFLSTKKVWI